MDFKKKISHLLHRHVKVKLDFNELLETPPDQKLGDYAFPCFKLSKHLKKNPAEIAKELSNELRSNRYIERIENEGPYLNFFINKTILTEHTIKAILKEKESYGSNHAGRNKKALIEHTSINPNASPHMGRARNAIIGDSIARLLKFEGYKTEIHYLVNDVGKQIAMLVLGAKGKKPSFNDLLKIYIDFNKKLEKKPALEKDVFALLNQLESGNKKAKEMFSKVVGICIKGQSKILSELGINYDYFDYESEYLWDNSTKKILKHIEKTGKVFTDENNRKVLDLKDYDIPMKSPVLVLTRNDGTSLYVIRDIAYTMDKMKKAHDLNLIVLGEDHKLYFKQLSIAMELLKKKMPEVVYYSYVLLKDKGKMSTRKGTLVLLEDIMQEAIKKAEKEIIKKHGKVKNLKKRAKMIAYGAIKYSILKVSADKNVFFDIDEALSFEGDSGPYVQYAYVRAMAILRKAGLVPSKADYSLLGKTEENKLVSQLSLFSEAVSKAFSNYQPHIIVNYIETLAKIFNEFYHNCQCLGTEIDKKQKEARLLLVSCTAQVLKNGLGLIGISAPEQM